MNPGFENAVMSLINQHGGVDGLLQQFKQGGLGAVASSWVSPDTANQSVAAAELDQTLDRDKVETAAQEGGMSTTELLQQLATHLPQIIDRMTPQGQIPDQASHGGLFNLAIDFLRSR